MRIPLEHFNHTPVYALSPNKVEEAANSASSQAMMPAAAPSQCKEKKSSLPVSLGLLGTNDRSVGSAPNSPSTSKRCYSSTKVAVEEAEEAKEAVPSISAGMSNGPRADFGPISLPAGHQNRIAKYATLPKNK